MNTPKDNSGIRFSKPDRFQSEFRPICLDHLIGVNHEARVLWNYVCHLDLSEIYATYKAREDNVGRNPVHPRILLTLWLYATIEGISSARHLEKRCERDAVYMWICGGVGVNRNLLNDFRTSHGDALNKIMVQTLATLQHNQLINFQRVSQDGMRVRANAGKSSFRRKDKLETLLAEAKKRVAEILSHDDNKDDNEGKKAAEIRCGKDRESRLTQALEEYKTLSEKREKRKKGDGETTRVSTTDPEARVMKMADNGFRPAYNVQALTLNGTRLVAGIDITNEGTDSNQMLPMIDQVEDDFGERPEEILADGGFNSLNDVTAVEQGKTRVFSPVRKAQNSDIDPYARRRGDSDEVFNWRQRMKTPEAQAIYKERCSTAEFPFARFRNHGLNQFPVRGIDRCRAVAIIHGLVHNFRQILHLGWMPVLTDN